MAYNWNSKIIRGDYIEDMFFLEASNIVQYVKNNHCSSDYVGHNMSHDSSNDDADYSSVNGSYSGGCAAHNSSVESSKYSSKCVNSYNKAVDNGYS